MSSPKSSKALIDDWLQQFFSEQQTNATANNHDVLQQLATLINRGGKRLRPQLCLLAYKGYGGQDNTQIIAIAGALELLHTFLLIHDDIIDRDCQRWGGPNITGVYFEAYSSTMNSRDALHFAEAEALLAGDICQLLAQQVIQNSAIADKPKITILKRINDITMQVIYGETSDVRFSHQATLPTEQEVLDMYRQKTASYSVILPLQVGALVAGAAQSELAVLAEIGELVGVAYQLQDDILGMFGDPEHTGKPNLSDLREAKPTVLLCKALELATPADRTTLQKIIGDENAALKELLQAQDILMKSGAYDYVTTLSNNLSRQAVVMLQQTSMLPTYKQQFETLLNQLLHRQT